LHWDWGWQLAKRHNKVMKPIFIFSLPRSGSTLLQRILSAHSQIASAAEPWILLPLAAMKKEMDIVSFSSYSDRAARQAIQDLVDALPCEDNYYQAVGQFVSQIYATLATSGESYFLDKTPRYYQIIDFIKRVFPDSKFIFLFRNPLSVLASMVTTWGGGSLKLQRFYLDLYRGPRYIYDGWQKFASNSFSLYYKDLVNQPEEVLRDLCGYLGLAFEAEMISDFSQVRYAGYLGDEVGKRRYQSISTESLERWKTVLHTPFRRWYAKRYISILGQDVVESFGESQTNLFHQIDKLPLRINLLLTLKDIFWLLNALVRKYMVILPITGKTNHKHFDLR